MKILIINAGSSSLKYQLIDTADESVKAKGLCERIGIEGSVLTHKVPGKEDYVNAAPMPTHKEAIQMVLDALVDPEHGVVANVDEISAVGHRVLHGGLKFTESTLVNEKVKEVIKECFPLGPLHNPANLMGIEACEAAMPGKPNVAVFDTTFGMAMEPYAYLYGIDPKYYEKYSIRRYGFHGTSHMFVSGETIKFAELPEGNQRVIVCHLGNGASISASIGGKCQDTSMGLTPLEGLIMGTRSGDMDPAVVQTIANGEGISVDEGIMEKASNVHVLTASFGWSDVETWESLYNASQRDTNGNAIQGNVFTYDTHNCMIDLPDSTTAVIQGLDGFIVAADNGTLMICRRDKEEMTFRFSSDIELKKLIDRK
jgi:acetate kinase